MVCLRPIRAGSLAKKNVLRLRELILCLIYQLCLWYYYGSFFTKWTISILMIRQILIFIDYVEFLLMSRGSKFVIVFRLIETSESLAGTPSEKKCILYCNVRFLFNVSF